MQRPTTRKCLKKLLDTTFTYSVHTILTYTVKLLNHDVRAFDADGELSPKT